MQNMSVPPPPPPPSFRRRTLQYGPGTFFGMPVLLCAGKGKKVRCWQPAPPKESAAEGKEAEASTGPEGGDGPRFGGGGSNGFTGAICPVTITAKEVGEKVFGGAGGFRWQLRGCNTPSGQWFHRHNMG